MRKNFFQLIKYALLLSLVAFMLAVFIPRSYDVPQMHERQGTQYWDLQTGSRIAYTLIPAKGPKKPFPIIYLQGGPGGFISNRNIEMLAPLSEDGYDIYLYDQIGSGLSDRLSNIKDYTADRHKIELEEIIQEIGATQVILIGQSWGASLAALFIADNPEKVERVVYTGPGSILPMREEIISANPPDSLNLRKPPYSNMEANDKSKNIRTVAVSLWARGLRPIKRRMTIKLILTTS